MTIEPLEIEQPSAPALVAARPAQRIIIAATFTAEPVQDTLHFWLGELNLTASVEFAPYDQVFQQLLDPSSLLAQNRQGLNVVLVRLEDWVRSWPAAEACRHLDERLAQNAADLVNAAKAAVARSRVPLLVGLCPDSPMTLGSGDRKTLFTQTEKWIAEQIEPVPGVYLIRPADYDLYPVADYYDPRRDQLGHIPYTPQFFAALGTVVARKAHTLFSPPYKVVVLDCDNTLWQGVVGEDGVDGITIPSWCKALQQFMVDLTGRGFVLCLCSKNIEPDVLAVFDRRPDMVLKRHHLVSWRVNWQAKSANIRSLAHELNLGLDSFIFLDDNPVECAEVRVGCPEVLTLQVPVNGDINEFIHHVWGFDRLRVTSEDRQRTAMYKQETDRARLLRQAPTIGEFLASLDLQIRISEPTADQITRVAQLTQRTNQFNFTTVRRNDHEVSKLAETNLECRVVEVSDRFGDYGLVGVIIFGAHSHGLEVDTFLLSCRVLGRCVEHRMLRELGELARCRQLSQVNVTLITTRKNQPARDFLDGLPASYRRQVDGGWRYEVPAEIAVTIAYSPGAIEDLRAMVTEPTTSTASIADAPASTGKSERFERIATELTRPEQVLQAWSIGGGRPLARRKLSRPLIPARTDIEAELSAIWVELLRIEPVGVEDDYFELGGTSLLAVDLFARIEQQFSKKLPLTSLIEASTIGQLAQLLAGAAGSDTLVLIRDGEGGPPLFLVHDGDGETMLYRNLALRLSSKHAIYGLQPYCRLNVPMAHTRIAEMAAYHIDRMRSVQPRGPYLVGGMCAGGVIAFEIALQLQREGEDVPLVALIDAADVKAPLKALHITNQRMRSFLSVVPHDQSTPFGHRILSVVAKALRKAKNLTIYTVVHQSSVLYDEIRMRVFRYFQDRRWRLPRALEHISVRTVYLFAEKHYEPMALFDGDVELFRATEGSGDDEPYVARYRDPLFGWGRRVSERVQVYEVPGGHSSMLQEPHVRILAIQLQYSIDEALAEKPALSHQIAVADPSTLASRI